MGLWSYRDKTATLADLQSAYRKVEQLESEASRQERERKDRLIAEKQRTGVKPDGWDRSVDREEKKRQDDASYHERVTQAVNGKERPAAPPPRSEQPATDFGRIVDAILKEEPKHIDLKLNDMTSNIRQGRVFLALQEYIDGFDGVSRQLEATYNLMRYLKRIAIELQPKTQEAHA
jgi:hypothetical protein